MRKFSKSENESTPDSACATKGKTIVRHLLLHNSNIDTNILLIHLVLT